MKIIKEDIKKVVICLLISMLIEIFFCNYPAFRTLFVGNRDIEAEFTKHDNMIKIEKIDTRVTSLTINYSNNLTDKITYFVKYVADDNSAEINLNPKVILSQDKQYINFDTHAKAKEITIEILTESEIDIENIIINHCNLRINFYRLLAILGIVIFIYKIADKSLLKEKYGEHEKFHNQIFLLNLLIFICMIVMYTVNQFHQDFIFHQFGEGMEENSILITPDEINKEDSILMQAEAIVNGHIKLLEEPSKELLEMENPYDSKKRDSDSVPYLYDVAYYHGNYYNYFGIAPIILLVVPFRMITGKYIGTHLFNLVFIIGTIFTLYSLYKKLIKKYVKEISICNFYLGYFTILFGSNFLTLLRGAKYDIVISSGLMFLLISLNLAISIYEKLKLKYLKLILLGFTTGLVVLSKPNLIIYYPLIIFFVFSSMKGMESKNKIIDSILILIPLGILAIFQMIFNYVRFDNLFEFGARYQLTGFNMNTCMSFTFGKAIQGVGEYLLKTPTINPFTFPFVFINTSTLSTTLNELCYENRLIGLVAIPVFWIYLFANNILSKSTDKALKKFVIIAVVVSFISIILNTCYGGICEAYSLDFKMILAIVAVILFMKAIEMEENKIYINKLFLIITIATILIMIPISFTTERNFLIDNTSSQTVFLKNIFEFWN